MRKHTKYVGALAAASALVAGYASAGTTAPMAPMTTPAPVESGLTGEVHVGRVPAYSVVVPGAMPGPVGTPSLYCAVIVKQVDERTRAKTAINELLRY